MRRGAVDAGRFAPYLAGHGIPPAHPLLVRRHRQPAPGARRAGTGLGALAAFSGAGVAGWHIYTKANPTISCGIDPLETSLNRIPPAEWFPSLFKADGLCSTPYPPILGLDVPEWALVWFVVFGLALGRAALRSKA